MQKYAFLLFHSNVSCLVTCFNNEKCIFLQNKRREEERLHGGNRENASTVCSTSGRTRNTNLSQFSGTLSRREKLQVGNTKISSFITTQ